MIEYIERIQATLDPFGGRFLVHGATIVVDGVAPDYDPTATAAALRAHAAAS